MSKKAVFFIIVAIFLVIAGALYFIWQSNQVSQANQVQSIVSGFGAKLQSVPISAASSSVAQSIKENYSDFVSPNLLAEWEKDPSLAPGRLASVPWPDRIEITSMTKNKNGSYTVEGSLVEITGAENVFENTAYEYPVFLNVSRVSGKWLITSFQSDQIGAGVLEGEVSIGPLCPVSPCPASTTNPYISRQLTALDQSSGDLIYISLNLDGSFETTIAPGSYVLNLTNCTFLGCSNSLPKTVSISGNKTTDININIDTGIR